MNQTEINSLKKQLKNLALNPHFVYFPGKSSDVVGTMVFELHKQAGDVKKRLGELRRTHGTMGVSGVASWGDDKKKPVLTLQAEGTGVTRILKDLAALGLKVDDVKGAVLANVAQVTVTDSSDDSPIVTLDLGGATTGEKLGEGSFGSVSTITGGTGPNGEPLVGKTFKGSDPEASLKAEVEVYERAGSHPNLVKVFGPQDVGGQKMLVMEGMPGGRVDKAGDTLRKKLESGEITQEEFWGATQAMLFDTLSGLAHLQRMGLMHNDVKGDNVMIAADGTVKLIDLGELSEVGGKIKPGHYGYLAPEKIDSTAKGSSEQESFSTGQMAHELVTGKLLNPHGDGNQNRNAVLIGFYELRDAVKKGTPQRVLRPEKPTAPTRGKKKDDPVTPGKATGDARTTEGYDSVYVKFLEELLNPDESLRLTPEQALSHPFFQDSLLSQDAGRGVLRKALGLPEPQPTVPPTPPTAPPTLGEARKAATDAVADKAVKKRVEGVKKGVEQAAKLAKAARAEVQKKKRTADEGAKAIQKAVASLNKALDALAEDAEHAEAAVKNLEAALPADPTGTKEDKADRKLLDAAKATRAKIGEARRTLRDGVAALENSAKQLAAGEKPASRGDGTKVKKSVRGVLKADAPKWQAAYEKAEAALAAVAPVLEAIAAAGSPAAARKTIGKKVLKEAVESLKAHTTAVPGMHEAATTALADLRSVLGGATKNDVGDRLETERKLEVALAAIHRNLGATKRRLEAVEKQITDALEA